MKYFAWVDASGIHGKERYTRYADFISEIIPTKLRELIGEVRKEVEGMKVIQVRYGEIDRGEDFGHNSALDSVLQLLDETGGK